MHIFSPSHTQTDQQPVLVTEKRLSVHLIHTSLFVKWAQPIATNQAASTENFTSLKVNTEAPADFMCALPVNLVRQTVFAGLASTWRNFPQVQRLIFKNSMLQIQAFINIKVPYLTFPIAAQGNIFLQKKWIICSYMIQMKRFTIKRLSCYGNFYMQSIDHLSYFHNHSAQIFGRGTMNYFQREVLLWYAT